MVFLRFARNSSFFKRQTFGKLDLPFPTLVRSNLSPPSFFQKNRGVPSLSFELLPLLFRDRERTQKIPQLSALPPFSVECLALSCGAQQTSIYIQAFLLLPTQGRKRDAIGCYRSLERCNSRAIVALWLDIPFRQSNHRERNVRFSL